MVKQCKCCGAVWPDREVDVGGLRRQRIFDFILRHPDCTMEEIVNYVYADDRGGGPDDPGNSVHGLMIRLREVLASYDLTITTRRGVGATYRIVPLPPSKIDPATTQPEGPIHGTT